MRREILTVSPTIEGALEDLEAFKLAYEDGDLDIEDVYDENGEFEGIGVVWTCEDEY